MGVTNVYSHIWILSLGFLVINAIRIPDGEQIENEYSSSDTNAVIFSSQAVLISLGVLCSLVLVISACSWSWWRRLIGRRTDGEVPTADRQWERGFDTLDAGNLDGRQREPVFFERIPSVGDLDPRQSFQLRLTQAPGIVPCSDEANIYAHDWFEPPHQNFPRSNVEYLKVVGKGWFGKVIDAEAADIVSFPSKIRVVVKLLREDATDHEQMRFLNETRLYRDATHANILKLLGRCIDTSPYILLMEHWPLGDLKTYLSSNASRAEILHSQSVIIRMALDVARGLEWMGSAGFVHGDLAARNCLVASAAGKVVIGDYGLSTQLYREDYYWSSNIAIPLRWAAPETILCTSSSIETQKVTIMSNVWTFGVVLWEIFEFGKCPYYGLSNEDVLERVITVKNYILEPPALPYLNSTTKDKLYKVMISCWNSVPENRPTISDVLQLLSTP